MFLFQFLRGAPPTNHPSNRESVRQTVRPVLLRRKANIVLSATTSTLFIATTKVAAVGRHHKRGAAASGRGTSFVVSFVVAMNRVDVVDLVVDLVDVYLDVDLVDVDLDVDLVDVALDVCSIS